MYIILTYDVQSKRIAKVRKMCEKYLHHVQRSVFEGEITDANLRRLKHFLAEKINPEFDSVCIYKMDSARYAERHVLGCTTDIKNVISFQNNDEGD